MFLVENWQPLLLEQPEMELRSPQRGGRSKWKTRPDTDGELLTLSDSFTIPRLFLFVSVLYHKY